MIHNVVSEMLAVSKKYYQNKTPDPERWRN